MEGYHLWAVTIELCEDAASKESSSRNREAAENGTKGAHHCQCEMLQFQFLKSALTVNPCMVSSTLFISARNALLHLIVIC